MIGVHYKGSGSYQTKLGALVTLATYVLMTVNMVTLCIAFNDVSSQDEKFQSEKIDRFYSDPVKFADNEIEIVLFTRPQVPARIAGLTAQ